MSIEIINSTDLQSLEPLFTRYNNFHQYMDDLEIISEAWDVMYNLSMEITSELDGDRILEIEDEFYVAKSDWECHCHVLQNEDEAIQQAVINRLEQAIEALSFE